MAPKMVSMIGEEESKEQLEEKKEDDFKPDHMRMEGMSRMDQVVLDRDPARGSLGELDTLPEGLRNRERFTGM